MDTRSEVATELVCYMTSVMESGKLTVRIGRALPELVEWTGDWLERHNSPQSVSSRMVQAIADAHVLMSHMAQYDRLTERARRELPDVREELDDVLQWHIDREIQREEYRRVNPDSRHFVAA